MSRSFKKIPDHILEDVYWRGSTSSRIHLSHPGYSDEYARKFHVSPGTLEEMRINASNRTLCERRSKFCNLTNKPLAVNCPTCWRRMRLDGILDKEVPKILAS